MDANNLHEGEALPNEFSSSFLHGVDGDFLEVAFIWMGQVLSVVQYPDAVRVGDDPKTDDLVVDHIEFPQPLIRVDEAGQRLLTVHESMHVYLNNPEHCWSLDEFIAGGIAVSIGSGWWEIALATDLRAQVISGDYTFLIRFSDALEAGHHLGFDRAPVPYIGMSATTHILMLMLIMAMPDNAGALELDAHLANDRFVQMAFEPEQEELEKPDWLDGHDSAEASAKHSGDEGAAGDPDEKATDNRMAIKGPQDNEDIVIKKMRDREIAMNSGIVATFDAQVASLLGTGDASIGSDALHAIGAIEGKNVGGSNGVFGLGVHGINPGGGGVIEGSLGLANVHTKGRATGNDRFGAEDADLGERDGKVPSRVIPQPIASLTGGLDREIIKRVVRKQRRAIKSCYDPELQKNKTLSGEVVVKFTISGTGEVIAAVTDASTLKNANVERCVNAKIRRWVFPEPKGGGMVMVRYPFRFTAGN